MLASDPSDETGIMEMAHNATAEKSGAAKYGHAQGHDAKVSPQLRLSHSHSTGGQSRHRPTDALLEDLALHFSLTVYHPTACERGRPCAGSAVVVRGGGLPDRA